MGRKQRKVWLWSAVDRASQHAPRLGCQAAGAPRLWQALPSRCRHHTRYFTDAWRAHLQVLLVSAHCIGKDRARAVGALNSK